MTVSKTEKNRKMGRHKGTSKTGGRRKGSCNKAGADLRQWVSAMIDGNRWQLEKDLKQLEPKDRWMVIERLMQYTLPKMQSVSADVELGGLTDEQVEIIVDKLLNSVENDNQD